MFAVLSISLPLGVVFSKNHDIWKETQRNFEDILKTFCFQWSLKIFLLKVKIANMRWKTKSKCILCLWKSLFRELLGCVPVVPGLGVGVSTHDSEFRLVTGTSTVPAPLLWSKNVFQIIRTSSLFPNYSIVDCSSQGELISRINHSWKCDRFGNVPRHGRFGIWTIDEVGKLELYLKIVENDNWP